MKKTWTQDEADFLMHYEEADDSETLDETT